jgi:CRISPR-associated protein Cmr4
MENKNLENKKLEKLVVTMYAESQIHAGKGMDVGIVDLPIQRERTTGFPIIQGIKGSLRANLKFEEETEKLIFGSDPSVSDENKESTPGQIAFSEAKILLFPVRHHEKLFVWVTSPLVLIRFLREIGKEDLIKEIKDLTIDDSTAFVIEEDQTEIMLEDFKFKAVENGRLKEIAEIISENVATVDYIKDKLKTDVVLVNDKIFSAIVETMTEIIPRIRIDKNTGTVATGALWYEEYLPQDTVMYFVARKTLYGNGKAQGTGNEDIVLELKDAVDNAVINIGGKETVGKGLVALKVVNGQ